MGETSIYGYVYFYPESMFFDFVIILKIKNAASKISLSI